MSWWQYLLLVNLYLVLFYTFYAFLLKRETFFQLNRVYLVTSGALSFLIPMIQADWVKNLFITQQVKTIIYSAPVAIVNFQPIEEQPVTIGQIFTAIYLGGTAILFVRIIWQLWRLNRLIHAPVVSAAYSFFNKVRLNHDGENIDIISAHEQVHVRQWHSADILLMEFIIIINWFNPMVYLYRRAIKYIHEFIADQQALNAGTNKSEYAMLLLSQTFNAPAHQLVNSFFNNSLLKQRIVMLQKSKSNRVMLVKYCLSAPLFILMLILSSATVNKTIDLTLITDKAERVLTEPATLAVNKRIAETGTNTNLPIPKVPRLFISANKELSRSDTIKNRNSEVYTAVEQTPDFPGGINMFMKFIGQNIRYPAEMRKNHIQGRVIATFIVEKDGSLSNINILRQPGYGSGEEAARVLALSPKWKPGMQNGKAVRVQYTVPINFTLADDHVKKDTAQQTGSLMPVGKTIDSKISGVIIVDSTGKNGQYYSNRTTDKNGNQPLFIIDGKETSRQGLTFLSSDKIKSIDVLKDKNARAIYGDKGVNGVIIITTKKADANQPK